MTDGEYLMEGQAGGGGGRVVHFNLPGDQEQTNGYGAVPGGFEPEDRLHRPDSIELQVGRPVGTGRSLTINKSNQQSDRFK